MMKRLLLAALAAAAIASAAPANATPPCQVNWELKSDGLCHPYYSTPINGYDPFTPDPDGQGFLRGLGPDSGWQ
jgi:opacity protein-like surface antigen